MPDVMIEPASPDDADALTGISIRAFHSDAFCGGPEGQGPPGYDSPTWQSEMMGQGDYFKILIDHEIGGGAIIFMRSETEAYLGRVFLDLQYHRKGIGLSAMGKLLAIYPGIRKWTLETPSWNARTRGFYLRAGFKLVRETAEDLVFEKVTE